MSNERRFNNGSIFALGIFFALIVIPYVAAYVTQGAQYVFGGFLLNPIDGNSYLAKMYQGWQGEITFQLPFTADPSGRVFLFVFYLALGHVARIAHLPLILTFHLARLLAAIFLCWAIYHYIANRFRDSGLHNQAFTLILLGLGAGWLVLPLGWITSDLWVAEGYPFLSAYVNPHFPLGLAIITILIFQEPVGTKPKHLALLMLLAVLLALTVPFGIVIVGAVLGVEILLQMIAERKWQNVSIKLWRLLSIALVSAPILIYDLWVVYQDPVLAGWNVQNLTPSPPFWDFLVAFSPALIFAILGITLVRKEQDRVVRLAAIWLLAGILLMYFPFGLQRRMISGLFIPVGILAIYWITSQNDLNRRKRYAGFLLVASLPSVVVIMLLASIGIIQKAPEIYLWRTEREAFEWIELETAENSLVLASPESGLLIPAYTGRRVLYGHPFETVNADIQLELVDATFENLRNGSIDGLPAEVDYIFWGPREATRYDLQEPLLPFEIVYQNDNTVVFSTAASQSSTVPEPRSQLP